ncbi:hypothetical protein Tco_0363749 [Tanacetum coccineum]
MGCAWKYLRNLLAAQTSARTSFSIELFKSLFCFWRPMEVTFLMHFFKVLNSGKDFSADLERNLFRVASFPLRLWTSLIVRGDGSCNTASVLFGHGFIPSGLIMYPRNIPSATLNVLTDFSVKGLVYQSLLCGASVLEAEGYFCVAIYPVTGVESRLFLILFRHLYLVIAFVGVQETLKGVATEGLDLPIDFWKGVTILQTGLV